VLWNVSASKSPFTKAPGGAVRTASDLVLERADWMVRRPAVNPSDWLPEHEAPLPILVSEPSDPTPHDPSTDVPIRHESMQPCGDCSRWVTF
jgi:hypothetical protein